MSIYSNERVEGFLHTDGRSMRNGRGEEIRLRGWAAGNWTNPEGFLCGDVRRPWAMDDPAQPPARFDRARSMEDSVRLLCGSEYAKKFWPRWYRSHLGEADIRAMAGYGYNSVRLPLNARAFLPEEPGFTWNEDSFAMLDDVLDWCERYRLYAILDLHTAPGGQSGIKCDDGLKSMPLFFLEEESMERSIRLWEEIARRYKDRWIVGGYDLLNEPVAPCEWFHLIPQLAAYYDRLVPRLRAIDKNHMLTIEGAAAATNMEIFDHNYDPKCNNWCIHVHFYGLSPERRSLFRYLEPSLRLNVPVWLGEGGGNAQEISALLEAADSLGMGFNLWSWKTSMTPDGKLRRDPVQYALPKGWDQLLDFFNGAGPRPGYTECQAIFNEMLENMKFENCTLSPEQHGIVLRRPGRRVPAAAYEPRTGTFSSGWEYGNPYDFRTEDGTRLLLRDGTPPPRRDMPFSRPMHFRWNPLDDLLLELDMGGYASYSLLDVREPCRVRVMVRARERSILHISCGDMEKLVPLERSTEFVPVEAFTLPPAEEHRVRVEAVEGRIQLESVEFL